MLERITNFHEARKLRWWFLQRSEKIPKSFQRFLHTHIGMKHIISQGEVSPDNICWKWITPSLGGGKIYVFVGILSMNDFRNVQILDSIRANPPQLLPWPSLKTQTTTMVCGNNGNYTSSTMQFHSYAKIRFNVCRCRKNILTHMDRNFCITEVSLGFLQSLLVMKN